MIHKDMLQIDGMLLHRKDGAEFPYEEIEDIFERFRAWILVEDLVFFGSFSYYSEPPTITITREDVHNNIERVWHNQEDDVVPPVVRPTYPDGVSPFELIKTEGYSGYIYEDVLASLNPDQEKDLRDWMNGQTMGLYEGVGGANSIIYAWDYDRWLQGLPVID